MSPTPYLSQQSVDDFGEPFSVEIFTAELAATTDTTLTVPGTAPLYKAVIRVETAADVWVALNTAAAAPAGATFASSSSEIVNGDRFLCREVKAADVIHFFAPSATTSVSVALYSLSSTNQVTIMADVKFSGFTDGNEVQNGDEVVGLRSSTNTRFDFPGIGIKDADGNFLFQYNTVGVSSVNYLNLRNSVALSPVTITAAGTDTNIGITVTPKGNGVVTLDGLIWPSADGTADQAVTTDGSGTLGFSTVSLVTTPTVDQTIARFDGTGGALEDSSVVLSDVDAITGVTSLTVDNINVNGNTISSTDAAGNIILTPDTTGDLVLDGVNWPQADGSAGQVLNTDGLGQTAWTAAGSVTVPTVDQTIARFDGTSGALEDSGIVISDVDAITAVTSLTVDNININGNTIISTDTNGNINITPDGTGNANIHSVVVSSADAITGVTSLDVDNININGNTIISTDTNGNIVLTPNGTGQALVATQEIIVLKNTSTNNSLARYDSTPNVIQDSGVLLTDSAKLSGIARLDVDNLTLDGNDFKSTDTNGDVTITPNGTGNVIVTNVLESASGISFDASVNVLSTYVGKTAWTPVPFGTGTAGTPVGDFTGDYFQIGGVVYITCTITFTDLDTMAGDLRISGLPVNVDATPQAGGAISRRNNFTNDFSMGFRFSSAEEVQIFRIDIDNTEVDIADLSATTTFSFSGFYFAI